MSLGPSSEVPDGVRAALELGGQRTAAFACECLRRNGYVPVDRAFREIGLIMLADKAAALGLSGDQELIWLNSAVSHFEALASGRAHPGGLQ